MSTDETNVGDADNNLSTESSAATGVAASKSEPVVTETNQSTAATAATQDDDPGVAASAPAVAETDQSSAPTAVTQNAVTQEAAADDDDEPRASGEDFGQLLDRF